MIFLLTYDRSKTCLLSETQYSDEDISAANDARLDAEIAQAGDSNLEVVILKSESREKLMQTHARYFKTLEELSR